MRRQQQALIAQDELKQTKKKTFKCLKCKKYSRSPVLTRCGHLFCWQCLYTATSITPSCPQCMELWNIDECYPVYTDYHQQQSLNQQNQQNPNSSNQLSTQNPIIDSQKPMIEVPSRPPAKHMQKILNPNMIGAGAPLSFNSLPSNLPMKRMLAGHVFLSPLGVNSFSVIGQGNQNDEDFKNSQKLVKKMSRTSRSVTFKNSILSKLHLNEIDQNPICPIPNKFRTKTNKVSRKSIITIQQEITSIKLIKPYNTEKLIKIQQQDYEISSIVKSQLYKSLQNQFLEMMDFYKRQKCQLKREMKEIDRKIRHQQQTTNKLNDKLVQISQCYQEVQSDYYEVKRNNYGLRCELSYRRNSQQRNNQINNDLQIPFQQINVDEMSYEQILEMEERMGKQNTGLTSTDIQQLPQSKLKDIHQSTDQKEEEIICCICCDNIDPQNTVIKLKCSHMHHAQCLKKWLQIQRFCPLCKGEVNSS